MKRFNVNMYIFIFIFTVAALSYCVKATAASRTEMEPCLGGLYHVYSSSVLTYQGIKRMWMGGWLTEAEIGLDKIYFTYKWNGAWLNPVPIQWTNDDYPLPGRKPGYSINDPSVIKHPQQNWLFMYYSALPKEAAPIEDWKQTCVGFASSIDGGYTWWDHGIILSTPNGVWSPSAIVVGNEIWIYYMDATPNIQLYRQKLKLNGWQKIGNPEYVSTSIVVSNVDVSMLGTKLVMVANTPEIRNIVRFESDDDGLTFRMVPQDNNPLIAGGPNHVLTPHVEVLSPTQYNIYFGYDTTGTLFHSTSIHAWTYDTEE